MTPARAPAVLKFGGATLSTPEAVIARVAEARRRGAVVVVVSARAGVTDALEAYLRSSRRRSAERTLIARLAEEHAPLDGALRSTLRALGRHLRGTGSARRRPLEDEPVRAAGERLGARWLSARLVRAGIAARPLDADRAGLKLLPGEEGAVVDIARSTPALRAALRPWISRGIVPVVTGYFGSGPHRSVLTLGRGGSDYSAVAVAAALGARAVRLFKSDGPVQTADPRYVAGARPVGRLSYRSAEDLSHTGGRVLHPRAVALAQEKGIEIRVERLAPGIPPTRVNGQLGGESEPVLSMARELRLIRVHLPAGPRRVGLLSGLSDRLTRAGVGIVALFTTATELSTVVRPASVRPARRALEGWARALGTHLEPTSPTTLLTAIGVSARELVGGLPPARGLAVEGLTASNRVSTLAVRPESDVELLRALHRTLVEPGGRNALSRSNGASAGLR